MNVKKPKDDETVEGVVTSCGGYVKETKKEKKSWFCKFIEWIKSLF